MKCTKCGEALGAAAFTIDLLLGDDHCTLNLHQRCMRELVGHQSMTAINALALKVGWVQLQLPGTMERHA